MSVKKYLEIDSTYRNRNLYPLPGQFICEISQSGTRSNINAVDPVCDSAPDYTFRPTDFKLSGGGMSITGNVETIVAGTVGSTTTPSLFIGSFPAGDAQLVRDYYCGISIVDSSIHPFTERRIISWDYMNTSLGLDRFLIGVDYPFPTSFQPGNILVLNNPTDFTDPSHYILFIPNGIYPEYQYINYFVSRVAGTTDFATIINYNPITRLAQLSKPNIGGWVVSQQFDIARALPAFASLLSTSTTTTIVLGNILPQPDGYYVGSFLYVLSGPASGESRRIVSWIGSSNTGTVYPPFSTSSAFNERAQIYLYTTDNAVPLVFAGSSITQSDVSSVDYDIELINLVLPNRILSTGRGSKIAFYPYVYIELENNSSISSGLRNSIYSNNPNSTKMLFRIPIINITDPQTSTYIKLYGDGMVQSTKFNPNDNISFSIRLPDGSIFDTIEPESFSPKRPNQLIQISACFSFKKRNI